MKLNRTTLDRSRPLMTAAAVLAVTLLVGACGTRGPLQPPAQAKAEGDAKSAESADAGSNSAAPKKPHEPFILDGLLR
jgi:predicted small lipoprotein YifL